MGTMVRLLLTLLFAVSLAPAQPALPGDVETELAPTDAQAWRRLGLARISANRLAQAEPALLRACTLEKPPVDSCYYLARNRHALAQYEPARLAFDLALAATNFWTANRKTISVENIFRDVGAKIAGDEVEGPLSAGTVLSTLLKPSATRAYWARSSS